MSRKKAQFGQVVSGYVDPTPEGLDKAYQRHMDNLINNESLRRQAASLQAAPFEGDQKLRRDLLSSTDAALNAVTQEASKNSYGNLSNFTTSVMRAGTLYQKGAAPITENLKRYSTYQQELADALEKKDIDAEDYNNNLLLSKARYKGLGVDEEGNATNYFQGVQAWRDPDLAGMIDQALGNISVDGNLVVQDIIGFNNGMYDVRTTEGIKQIHPDKINAALSGVFNDPKVQGYYGRKAEGRVFGMKDEQVSATLQKKMESLQEAEEPDLAAIGKIQQLIDSGNSKDMRDFLEFNMKNDILNTYRQSAVIGKSQMDTVNKREVDYNPIYLETVKAQMKASAEGTSSAGVVFTDEGIAYQRPGGGTSKGADKEIRDLEDGRARLQEELEKAIQDGLPDERVRSLQENIADLDTDLSVKLNAFKYIYGIDREKAKNDPEYKELQRRIRESPYHSNDSSSAGFASTMRQMFSGLMAGDSGAPMHAIQDAMDYNSAQQDLRDYMVDNAVVDEDPRGETGTVSMQYVPLSSFGLKPARAKEMEQDITDYFNSTGFKPSQQVINPNTGEVDKLENLGLEGDLKNYEFDSVLINKSLPSNGIPSHMRVSYKDTDREETGTLLIPLNTSGGTQIPSVSKAFSTPSVKFQTQLDTYRTMFDGVGGGVMEIDWAGYYNGDRSKPFYGTLDFDIQKALVTLYDNEGNELSPAQDMQHPLLLAGINTNEIQLR